MSVEAGLSSSVIVGEKSKQENDVGARSPKKKARLEMKEEEDELGSVDDDEEEDASTLLANDLIDLIFIEPEDDEDLCAITPTYTHQLFENEAITFLRPEVLHHDARVKVYIRCLDLAHMVAVPKAWSEGEKTLLMEAMRSALPAHDVTASAQGGSAAWTETVLTTTGVDEKKKLRAFTTSSPSSSSSSLGTHQGQFVIGNDTYELWLATHANAYASSMLRRLEGIAKWFIETADGIDFSDDRWECLFLTRRRNDQTRLSLCGYFTLFTFRNPFVGAKLRICQALVFPHLQGKGLGQKLFGAVYELAQKRRDVLEVTVEDPAPAFQSLRDRVDFARAIKAEKATSTTGNNGDAENPEEDQLRELQQELKITKGQATFVLEAKAYANLNKTKSGSGDDDGLSSLKSFRLGVKRRLCKEKPALMKLPKEERQEVLEELFDEQEARFKAVEKLYRITK